jgi:putative flippase GtrA
VQRGLYDASIFAAALSICCLVAPVAYHRWVFRLRQKEELLRTANFLSLIGLATVAFAILCSVSLVITFVAPASVAVTVIACCVWSFLVMWFLVPIRRRRLAQRSVPASER